MKNIVKILLVSLTFCLLAGLLAAAAWAEPTEMSWEEFRDWIRDGNTLDEDVTVTREDDKVFEWAIGFEKTLDLNGHTLTLVDNSDEDLIRLSGGGSLVISGGENEKGKIVYRGNSEVLFRYDGDDESSLTLDGIDIERIDPEVEDGLRGMALVLGGGRVLMKDCTVSGFYYGIRSTGCSIVTENCEITGCALGVDVSDSVFEMKGGRVAENAWDAIIIGGGADFSLSGGVVIEPYGAYDGYGNWVTAPGLRLESDGIVTVTGPLTEGASISVLRDASGVFAVGGDGYDLTESDAACFTSFSEQYEVRFNADDAAAELVLLYHTIFVDTRIRHGSVEASPTAVDVDAEDRTVFVDVMPEDGYALERLYYVWNDAQTEISASGGTFSFEMPLGDIRIAAEFAEGYSVTDMTWGEGVEIAVGDRVYGGGFARAAAGDTVTVTVPLNMDYDGETGELLAASVLTELDVNGVPDGVTGGWDPELSASVFTFEMPDEKVELGALWTPLYNFSAVTDDGAGNSVGDIETDAEGLIFEGDEITVTAPTVPGYTFLGWFDTETTEPLAETLVYTFEITWNTELVARYEPRGDATVTVMTQNGALFTVGSDPWAHEGGEFAFPLGTELTLTAVDADRVLEWQNASGKRLGAGASLTLTVTGDTTVTLVYRYESGGGSAFVRFVSESGQVLKAGVYTLDDEVVFPDAPSKFGYSFIYWTVPEGDGGGLQNTPIDTHNFRDVLIQYQPNVTLVPVYEQIEEAHTVTVFYSGVERAETVHTDLALGSGFALVAPKIAGYGFECWKNENGEVLSCRTGCYIQITGDIRVTACYAAEDMEVEVYPVITIDEPTAVTGDVHKVTAVATRSIPASGWTLIEHGVLYARDFAEPDENNFVVGGEGVSKYISNTTSKNGYVRLNVKVETDDVAVTLRGYMILRSEATGRETVFYTPVKTASYGELSHP